MKRLFLLLFAALYLPAGQKPPKMSASPKINIASLDGLPADLRQEILRSITQYGHALNVDALAKNILRLAGINKAWRATVNNLNTMLTILNALPRPAAIYLVEKLGKLPVVQDNMLVILKSLPKAGAKVLASDLKDLPGMKSKEVQDWLKSIKLEGGQELYEAIRATPPNVNAILKMIEEPNIDVNWNKNNDKLSALMLISETEYKEIAKTLLATGANVTMRDIFGDTPLMYASRCNRADMVQLLLASGAPINTKNKYGWTALRMAGENGLSQIVMSLLAAGADPFIKDSKGKSVLEIARFEARYHPHQPQADRYNITIKLLEDAEKAQKEMAACK